MKKVIVLLTILIITSACGSTSLPRSGSNSTHTGLPASPIVTTLAPSPTLTATQLTATFTPSPEPTLTSTPTDEPTSTPTVAPFSTPITVTLTSTESASVPASGIVTILTIYFDGAGDKEPNEFVEICNDSGGPIQLKGWLLQDKARHVFVFPDFIMQPDQVCRIYTNEVHPESCGFSFVFSSSAIWNNGGDCAYLKDHEGNTVAEYCY